LDLRAAVGERVLPRDPLARPRPVHGHRLPVAQADGLPGVRGAAVAAHQWRHHQVRELWGTMGEAQVVAAGWHRRERGGLKVTTKQAAELLGITPQGVRMLALRGRLRRYGSGRPGWYDLA